VPKHIATIAQTATATLLRARSISFFVLLFALLGGTPSAWSQIDSGTIRGVVVDSTGAVVPGAMVSVRNEENGLVEQQASRGDGAYNFTALKVGVYTVTARAAGFETVERKHLSLSIQQELKLDLSLKVGGDENTVDVTAGQVVLQTQEASVGQTITEGEINNLPLNGRNYTLLAQLAPGTTTTTYDNGHGEVQSGSFTANGMNTVFNNYLLDGITNNNMTADFGNGNSFTLKPPPDGLSEFKVETANYSAEYGRSGGAVINAVTKSGQNSFFGDVWEYNRNAYFDAEDYFLKKAGLRRPKYNRNQFGFSLGGPVVIPRLYSGKDKTFFFFDYEGTRIRQGQAYTSSVPTALEQSSGFTNYSDLLTYQTGTQTDILGRKTKVGQIFDPATIRYLSKGSADPVTGAIATATGYVREPFASNIIPANRISPVSAKLLSYFPQPNANSGNIANNYVSAPVLQQTGDNFDTRIDQNFSARDQIFGRVSYGSIPRVIPGPCPTLAVCGTSATVGNESDVIFGTALGETHVFSSRLVNELRIGYNRIHMNRVQPYGSTPGLNAANGIPGIPDNADLDNGGLAQIKITGLSELGEHNNVPLNEIGAESQFNENVSLDRGRHSMRFGVSYERIKNAIFSAQFPHGYFAYSGTYTDLPNGNTASTGIAQFAIEPTLSSVPSCTVIAAAASGSGCQTYNYSGGSNQIQGSPLSQQDYRRPYFGSYFTDTWKLTSTFTATLGLRWEYFEVGTDHRGHAANFVPSFASGDGTSKYLIDDRAKNIALAPSFVSLLAQEHIDLVYTANHQLQEVPEKNFSPRVGFAWNFSPKSVLRGGYGLFYAGIYARGDGYNPGDDYPFTFAVNITSANQGGLASDSSNAIGPIDKGLAGVPLAPASAQGYQISPRGIQYHTHIPYVQATNVSLQQDIGHSQYFQVAYVGTMSRHIESNIQSNQNDLLIPANFSVSPVSPGPNCKDSTLLHDSDPNNPHPTTQDNSVYYDQYPCLAQKNYYQWLEGSNNYNSLQTKYEKLYSDGTSLLVSYTWEKLLGYGSDSNLFAATSYRAPLVPGFGMQGEYGNISFESQNVLHAGGIWEVPFGYGRRFGSHRGAVDAVAGGWNFSGILTYQSGQPITIGCVSTHAASSGCYANHSGSSMYSGAKTVNHWLNGAAFADPAVSVTMPGDTDFSALGAKPGQAFGPVFHRGDLGVQKIFHLAGSNVFQFRAEAFNVTNTPNFSQPGTLTYTSTSFAQITGTRDAPSDAREFQFALKFIFGTGHQE
jgi:Carboxypeptidase regulatory-like domain/TonB dependent receptor/TonB-dependent Receptor Plug Domain